MYRKGSNVSWKWGQGSGSGHVKETFTRRVQRTIGGSKIVKNGSEECPAYLIEQDDGSQVLKLHSEIERN
ncbi:MAG TPA: DUF2945 domain-containing protein [Thermoleophilaceae bacterium]|nr:DUF2945 domain-containing protein [Thermoleophilaceae bacterium]